jgi:hypothetical protein
MDRERIVKINRAAEELAKKGYSLQGQTKDGRIAVEKKNLAKNMFFPTNKEGNLVLTFTSNLNIDNGYTNVSQGEHESTMTLYLRDGEPVMIEWVNPVTDAEHIGIEYDEDLKEVTGYDGVFELPAQAILLLEHAGYKISPDL